MHSIIDLFTPTWTASFDELKSELKTGDIILVHGRYPGSWIVEKLQGCKWGHCCMVVLRQDIDPRDELNLPELLIWESNSFMEGSAPNLWGKTRTVKDGPMLVGLEERLKHSQQPGAGVELALRPLMSMAPLDFSRLPAFFDSQINKRFPKREWDIFASVYLGRSQNKVANHPETLVIGEANEAKSTVVIQGFAESVAALAGPSNESAANRQYMYCSELLAATYKYLGLLTRQYVSNAYTPADFSDTTTVQLLKNSFLLSESHFNIND